MNKDWVTITEAVGLVDKSEMTIRRFVTEYKNNEKAIKKDKGKVYIKLDFLSKHYPLCHDSQMIDNEQIVHQKDFAELAIQKQEKDIINKLIDEQNKPFLRLPVFWVTIGFIVLIVCMLFAGWLYRNEIISNTKNRINDLKQNYSLQIQVQKTELSNQKERYKGLKDQYSKMINELRSSYQKLTSIQEKQIAELTDKLAKLNPSNDNN